MLIVADENMPGLASLDGVAEVRRFPGRTMTGEMVRDADALFVRSVTTVNASLLEGSSVRFVGSATIGTDHVDTSWLENQAIGFAHAPGCNAQAVAEYVLQASLRWAIERSKLLKEMTIGVIGVGNVGARVAALFGTLGCTVVLCDPPKQDAGETAPAGWKSLQDVLGCDVVSLHVPLLKDGPYATHHLLDADRLGGLTSEQLLLNTCRGPVIDNQALLSRLAHADAPTVVLDVWESEPVVPRALFEKVFVGTPHIAGYSAEGKLRGSKMVLDAFFGWQGLDANVAEPIAPQSTWRAPVTTQKELLALLAHRYAMLADHERLADSLSSADPARAFDELRRQYPQRHELSGVTVAEQVDVAWRLVLSQLGIAWL
ncbi:MAG: 4-phosphoerythronate dehydrogenase [Alcanivoracaceae bacterium]|nr:4-phosphoerythronate dehydrogenase [Alcanivoracaceae bacterium]